MPATPPSLADLNERSRDIFRQLVETYLSTGEPVGSRTLSRASAMGLSAATIRNVMQDLELLGLLDSPHVSAGRVPTHLGLRLFVDAVLEIGDISLEERAQIERAIEQPERALSETLDEAGALLSGLSQCASLVYAPKRETPVEHVEFVSLGPDRALAVLVMTDGTVENRVFDPPPGLTPSAMREAANFLNAQLRGRTWRRCSTRSASRSPRGARSSTGSRPRWWSAESRSGRGGHPLAGAAHRARPREPASRTGRPRTIWSGSVSSSTIWSASAISRAFWT